MEQDIDVRTYFSNNAASEIQRATVTCAASALERGGIKTMNALCAAKAKDIRQIRDLGTKRIGVIMLMKEKYLAEKAGQKKAHNKKEEQV